MIGRLNHIGIAVPDLDQALKTYRLLFGIEDISEEKIMVEMGVRLVFIYLENTQIELMEAYGEASPLIGFLEKNPKGGQHHICYEVADLDKSRDDLLKKGAVLAGSDTPYIGAHGKPVLFLHPKTCHGVLIELMQS